MKKIFISMIMLVAYAYAGSSTNPTEISDLNYTKIENVLHDYNSSLHEGFRAEYYTFTLSEAKEVLIESSTYYNEFFGADYEPRKHSVNSYLHIFDAEGREMMNESGVDSIVIGEGLSSYHKRKSLLPAGTYVVSIDLNHTFSESFFRSEWESFILFINAEHEEKVDLFREAIDSNDYIEREHISVQHQKSLNFHPSLRVAPADYYNFTINEPRAVKIKAIVYNLGTVLFLLDERGEILFKDEDGIIDIPYLLPGRYVIELAPYRKVEPWLYPFYSGAYSLSIKSTTPVVPKPNIPSSYLVPIYGIMLN